jgi:PAS domain S-box-containing protein
MSAHQSLGQLGGVMANRSHDEASEVGEALREWRARALYVLLIIVVLAGLPAYVSSIVTAIRAGAVTPLPWIYAAVYLVFVALAVLPRIDLRLRSWGFLLAGYTTAVASFARLGLAGSGRLYLIAMPIIAVLLVGGSAGYATAALSLLIYGAFALMAHTGLLADWLTVQTNPLTLTFWADAGLALAVFLMVTVALLVRFYRLQVRTLAARHEADATLTKTAQALEEQEARFAAAMEVIHDGIWDWDIGTGEVFYSPRWRSMLGYADHEIGDRFEEWQRLVHPDDLEQAQAELQAHLEGRTSIFQLEHRLRHKDGSYRCILARGIAFRGADGKPYRMTGSHTDVTERRQAEEALQQSEGNMRSLLENAKNFAVYRIAVDPSNPFLARVLVVSPSMHDLFGVHDLQDFSSWFDAIHPDDLPRIVEANRRSLEMGVPFDQQLRFSSRERGEWTWGQVTSTPVFDAKGKLTHFNGLVVDITEQRQAQEALQVAYQTLERRVQERTRELAAVNAVSAVVSRSLDLREVAIDALDKTLEVMGMDLGVVYRLGGSDDEPPEDRVLSIMAHRGISADLARSVEFLPLRGSFVERAAAAAQPVEWLVADYPAGPRKQALQRDGVQAGVSIPLLTRGRLVGAVVLGARDARPLAPEELSLLAAIGQQVGVAVENAHLYEAEQERRAETERRRQVAENLREILAVLNSTRSLDEILEHIVTTANQLLGSDAIALCRLDQQSGMITVQASHGLEAEFAARLVFRAGTDSTVGRAVATRQPAMASDLAARVAQLDISAEWEEFLRPFAARYRAALAAPMVLKDQVYGAIALYFRSKRQFTEEEIGLATMFADQAALAVENARLREQVEQTAAFAERSRLARELHDSATQSLYSVTMFAEAATRLLATGDTDTAAGYLHELRDTAQEALREMRLLIFELRPPALEKGGLAAAIRARLETVEERGGIKTELQVDGVESLPFALQQELYHVAREALNNVLKHAHAQRVQVRLRFQETSISLEIQDDGVGFEPSAGRPGGGMGLPGMEERAQRLGGRLEIKSTPGEGTRVILHVPVDPSASESGR